MVMSKTCYIVGSGDFTARDLIKKENDFLIAADGGYRYLEKIGMEPDLLVGDFDSLDIIPEGVRIYRFPVEKDDTDMGLAIQKGIEMGYTDFALYAGSGTRNDHFFANLQLLNRFSEKGCSIRMICPECNIHALKDTSLVLSKARGTVFSVFALSDSCEGVSIKNAKYEVDNVSLSNRFPLGVSNEFVDGCAEISVKSGVLLVFEYLSPSYK